MITISPIMLHQMPPAHVLAKLREEGVTPEQLRLCTQTDIDRLGRYQPKWVVVTDERLLVVTDEESPRVRLALSFAEVAEFRNEPVIGSGILQARVDGMFIDVVRYSNRLADRFGKVGRKLERRLHGEPITVAPEEQEDKRPEGPAAVKKGAVLVRMAALMRAYTGPAILMGLLLVIGIALDLVSPQLTRILVDRVLPGSPERVAALNADDAKFSEHIHMLLIVVAVLAAVQVLRSLVNIFNGRLSTRVGTAITSDMRNRLVNHLQQLSVSYYDRQQIGSLVARVAYDTEALHGFINQITSGFLFQIVMLVGVGVMMFTIDARLALYALLPAPLVIGGTIVFWRYIYPRYYRYWDASSKQAGMLSAMLSGIRVVKAFSQEEREMRRFSHASDTLRDNRRNVDMGVASFNPVMGLVFQLGGWIVWFIGGRNVLRGHITLGELMAFFGYLWMFYGPLATLTQLTNWLTQFVTQAHRIFEVLDTPVQIAQATDPVRLPSVRGEITFESVRFGYTRHAPVLHDVTMHIPAGQMVGVVGRSGSGKTTIINLLCRFYDVDEGRVLIDGLDVRQVSKEDLRRQIGVVLQEPFLFRGSIWDNLAYGKPQATPEEVIAAAKAGNCHDFILRKAHAYDTWVGEQGAGLSGGERQRVGIARVLLTDPRILILDEATSSVDAESEAAIQAALAEVVRGRTTIAIAHRLSTLRNADRIIVVDAGKIAEDGLHHDLATKEGGLYAKLLRMQGQQDPSAASVDHLAEEARAREAAEQWATAAKAPAHHPRWLTPDAARIHLGNRGALHVTVINDRIYSGVFALCCLPVQFATRYISLRYLNEEKHEVEVGILRDMEEWPEEARDLVRKALLKRYFVHTILGVHRIELLPGFHRFRVATDLGDFEFIMRSQTDRAQDYGPRGKMILDIDENRYLVPDVEKLPDADRALFRRYIYW